MPTRGTGSGSGGIASVFQRGADLGDEAMDTTSDALPVAAAASTASASLWDGALSQGSAMEVSQSPPGLAADSTGLSQGVGGVSLHPDPPAAFAGRHTTAIELRRDVL